MLGFSRGIALLFISSALFCEVVQAQTTTVIRANLAAGHVGEYATVEGLILLRALGQRIVKVTL